MKVFSVLLVSSLLFLACSGNNQCSDPVLQPAFVNYSRAEIDTIIINKYSQTSGNPTPLNSIMITPTTMADYYTVADTTFVDVLSVDAWINPYFNWQIIVPATQDTFWLKNMVVNRTSQKCKTGFLNFNKVNCICYNSIESMQINNQPTVATLPINGKSNFYLFK